MNENQMKEMLDIENFANEQAEFLTERVYTKLKQCQGELDIDKFFCALLLDMQQHILKKADELMNIKREQKLPSTRYIGY